MVPAPASFQPDIAEIRFALDLCGFSEVLTLYGRDGEEELAADILQQAGRFASNELASVNSMGDRQGCHLENGRVELPAGFGEAYRKYATAGWNGLALPLELGGQNMPVMLVTAVSEIFNSANMALTMGIMPVNGAIALFERYGSPEQKSLYIPKIVNGEWTVTMAITEPQAGSDVGAIRTVARREGEHYRIRGQKCLITFGDHEMTDNIVHLVLARTPDAPAGVKGLSLFVVPKRLAERDGGGLNDISCIALESKMGLRASPTATLVFGQTEGAHGELLGSEHKGLEQMFILMNRARLNVGVFGLASAEAARQVASRYAQERVQGRNISGEPTCILFHPDVRRMVQSMTARTEAARYIAYYTAFLIDRARVSNGNPAAARLELMTPVTKAWCTETGFEVASLGVQIHGGLGYNEESQASQYFREARVHTIYEGTTGVQANDLIFRKIRRDSGATVAHFIAEMREDIAGSQQHHDSLRSAGRNLELALDTLDNLTRWIVTETLPDATLKLQANSAHYLMLFGCCVAGWLSLKAASHTARHAQSDPDLADRKMRQALFFMQQVVPPAAAMSEAIVNGADAVLGVYRENPRNPM